MATKKKTSEKTTETPQVVLDGTYRKENADWIKEHKLYNLPLPSCGKVAFHENISQIVLLADGFQAMAFAAKFREVVDAAWLKENGYKVAAADKTHGTSYALYELGEKVPFTAALSNSNADVFVASSRCPSVKIDAAFYAKPYPKTGGKSMPYIFDKLKPYFKKWHSATTFDPVQLDFFTNFQIRTMDNEIRVIELFAGVGGFRIGLERASKAYKTVWSNQWEPSTKRQDASLIYQSRFGVEGHSNEDIAKVPVDEIPNADLLVGGFPCQDYSVATTLRNSGGIEGKKGVLWWQIHRILRDSKNPPKYLFLENVDRLLKSPAKQRGRDFAIILGSLSDLGYSVEWRVINAADYGMPQRRRRTYILAYRQGTKLFGELKEVTSRNAMDWLGSEGVIAQSFPCKLEDESSEFNIEGSLSEITENFNKNGSAKSSFADAGVMINRCVWTCKTKPVYNGAITTLGDVLVSEEEVPEEFFIDGEELETWTYLKGPKSETRTTPDGFQYHYSEGGMAFPDSIDKPSRTIITGEGGKSPSRFKHVVLTESGRYRRLIPLELERLNMFPDNHTQGATDGRRAFLMGNALVTGIVEHIGETLLHCVD